MYKLYQEVQLPVWELPEKSALSTMKKLTAEHIQASQLRGNFILVEDDSKIVEYYVVDPRVRVETGKKAFKEASK